jgi:hypothetical protein
VVRLDRIDPAVARVIRSILAAEERAPAAEPTGSERE